MAREARTGRKACGGYWTGGMQSQCKGWAEVWSCDDEDCPNRENGAVERPESCPRNESDDRLYNSPARTT